jgi:SAM-dependent methyltransferase
VAEDAERWTGLGPQERPFRETSWFYAEYRYRPDDGFLRLLASHLGWSPSDRILDLGAGPAHVSLRLAPFVGEVLVMDPEEDMIDEARRRAATGGVENLSFVVGGSDDLARLAPDLGVISGAMISQAFHWMADQDAVLRALDALLTGERSAVAIVGYVKDPDYNRIWIDRPPWDAVEQILRRRLDGVPKGPSPAGRHDPFPDILARSPFSDLELLTHEHEAVVEPSVDAALGFHYSLGNTLAGLGEQREAFEAEVRTALADADTSPIAVRLTDSVLIGRRPS